MVRSVLLAIFFLVSALGLVQEKKVATREWNFDSDKTGESASGFTTEVGEWKVVADESAPSRPNVLAQTAKSEKPVYNIALVKDVTARDVDISVRFKAVAGSIDRGGGVVWRARDAKNYYITRYNPLEENFRVYKVVDGKRTELGSADIEKQEGWHTVRATMSGDRIECFYDGKKHLEVTDGTFAEAGRIGLWTKADAQTHFDDLTLTIR
jgi:hypothetical protein